MALRRENVFGRCILHETVSPMRTADECRAKSAEALAEAGRQSDARFKARYEEMARAWAELATMAERQDILAGLARRPGYHRAAEMRRSS
jgi:hypothetical protein